MKKYLEIIVRGFLLSENAANSFMNYGDFKEIIKSDSATAENYIYGLSSGVRTYETFMKKVECLGVC